MPDPRRARVFPPGDRRIPAGPATPAMHREEALAENGVWLGTVTTEPRTLTGWHHHGSYDTYVYVVTGSGRVDTWIDDAIERHEAPPGSFLHIPRGTVHREGSASDTGVEAVLVRVGEGQVVFPVEGLPEGD